MLQLLVVSDTRAFLFTLPPDRPTRVGRGEGLELRLDDPLAAPLQLLLTPLDGDRVEVTDLAGGARLNEVQLSGQAPLRPGDELVVGGHRLVLQLASVQPPLRSPRVWPHVAFEARLEEQVDRLAGGGPPFTLVLLKSPVAQGELRTTLPGSLAVHFGLPVVTGELGPEEIEVLAVGLSATAAQAGLRRLIASLGRAGQRFQVGYASAPEHGSDEHALFARAWRRLTGDVEEDALLDDGVGRDPVMARLDEVVNQFAGRDAPVLVRGEPGAGKRELARALHLRGPRAGLPFVDATREALESGEALERAGEGTVYVPAAALSSPGVRRQLLEKCAGLGTAATGPRLVVGAAGGKVAAELAPQLERVSLTVPALRDRPAEIVPLAELFLGRARHQLGRKPAALTAAARRLLAAHRWPGNMRELRNAMVVAALGTAGTEVRPEALPGAIRAATPEANVSDLRSSLKDTEREALLAALARTHWNVTLAAKQLGLPRRTVVYRMARLGLRRPER